MSTTNNLVLNTSSIVNIAVEIYSCVATNSIGEATVYFYLDLTGKHITMMGALS